jgi:hypothetical protein
MVASSGKSFATSNGSVALRLQSAHDMHSGKPRRRTSPRRIGGQRVASHAASLSRAALLNNLLSHALKFPAYAAGRVAMIHRATEGRSPCSRHRTKLAWSSSPVDPLAIMGLLGRDLDPEPLLERPGEEAARICSTVAPAGRFSMAMTFACFVSVRSRCAFLACCLGACFRFAPLAVRPALVSFRVSATLSSFVRQTPCSPSAGTSSIAPRVTIANLYDGAWSTGE